MMSEKPISFLREFVSFRNCFQQTAPTDIENAFCFAGTISVLAKHFIQESQGINLLT